jgi:hypothetical protein
MQNRKRIDIYEPLYNEVYRFEGNKLSMDLDNLTDQEVEDIVLPFLNEHPEITNLDLSYNPHVSDKSAKLIAVANTSLTEINIECTSITDNGVKALATNTQLVKIQAGSKHLGVDGIQAAQESNPTKRANYGREKEVGIQTEVPSLKRLCLFAVKSSPQLDQSSLCEDLIEELAKPKV